MSALPKQPNLFLPALLVFVLLGSVLGYAFPHRAEAANFWEEWFDIPAGGTTGQTVYLNCGWHTECVYPYDTGSGLDWDANADNNVYFAGAARWDGTFVQNAAFVNVSNQPLYDGSMCNNTIADVYNWYTSAWLTTQVYTHTTTGGTGLTVYAYSSPWPIRASIGNAVYPENLSGCVNAGLHIHNRLYAGASTNTGGYPIASNCNVDACASYSNQTWVCYNSWTQ